MKGALVTTSRKLTLSLTAFIQTGTIARLLNNKSYNKAMMTNHQRTRWEYICQLWLHLHYDSKVTAYGTLNRAWDFSTSDFFKRLILERPVEQNKSNFEPCNIHLIDQKWRFKSACLFCCQWSLWLAAFFPSQRLSAGLSPTSRWDPEDLGSSGNGPDEPLRGSVRVVKLSPHFPATGRR